jgi:hypothetical protein
MSAQDGLLEEGTTVRYYDEDFWEITIKLRGKRRVPEQPAQMIVFMVGGLRGNG